MKRCIACDFAFVADRWVCPRCRFSVSELHGHLAFAPELARDNPGFRPEYFRELAELEAANFWFRSRNRLIAWAIGTYFPKAESFFEIGCGTGFVLSGLRSAFPGLRLAGSEIYSIALDEAAGRVNDALLLQMDARHIPFTSEYDVIGAFDVLEHIEEDERVLSQMHDALAPGGGIVLTVPQHAFLWSRQDDYACHVRRYEADELAAKVRRAGFTLQRATSFVSLLLPLMFLSRRRKRGGEAQFDALSELRVQGVANTLLEGAMAVERAFIQAGVSLPMGGSLLMVARKPQEA
jgi:SAM-dependent methyltransferase